MKILVTGGAGYIGRTVVSVLLDSGHIPVILDSLIKGPREFTENQIFYCGDIGDSEILSQIFTEHPDIVAVMHFAALIDIEESTRIPSKYYTENLLKSQILLNSALSSGIKCFLFSSTAAVYRSSSPKDGLREDSPLEPLSAYAASKLMFERIVSDICHEKKGFGVALRYFNPIGADPLMRSGPYNSDPSHLLGKLTKLPAGGTFTIYGNDYSTRDGTPMRDFIHVWDLAEAHVAALHFAMNSKEAGFEVINIGSGIGVTVQEFVDSFLGISKTPIKIAIGERRPGDSAGAFANTLRAKSLLNWSPRFTLDQGISDSLSWEKIWLAKRQRSDGVD
ncbi:UDP-glucose 4-epimerase GalE [Deinococcus sp. 6YEL10]|uniref:UDP-glucose 4-epimerase GalE n=1 Tax=Deinococcus sp. 6YEL10 TaxID=2745870 RepID=UPI001E4ECB70|nr:UDP-glucose 4-epimerase GalE [Deinococcus sp. 6YEL10]MCD0160626.1 UDP-glucose 4-epimerase GalE [Deinococcus sp. 6YEL10]